MRVERFARFVSASPCRPAPLSLQGRGHGEGGEVGAVHRRVSASPCHRVRSHRVSAQRRRASVLVLVMTLLGVLFVVGVAFLATMNFEAEMIAAQSHQGQRSNALNSTGDQVGMMLRDIFANPIGGEVPYAELPQVHPTFSPIEPSYMAVGPGGDNLWATGNEVRRVIFPWATGMVSRQMFIDPSLPVGIEMFAYGSKCVDGPQKDQACPPATCPGSICQAPVFLDADGDGINDSVQVLASDLGLSEQQVAALAAQLNPPSNPGGRVFAALRVVPHGGMVNLNDAHPLMIGSIFADLTGSPVIPDWYHSPRDKLVLYSPLVEEYGLRHRGILPPYLPDSSLLLGDPFTQLDGMNADMDDLLMWPAPGGTGVQTVRQGEHQYEPFRPCDALDPSVDCVAASQDYWRDWWHYRMEPITAGQLSYLNPSVPFEQYDRRHLVTTVSHDDLIARPSTVPIDNGQRADFLVKMREANAFTEGDLDSPCALAFEYSDYPQDMPNRSDPTYDQACDCPKASWCEFDERKGRLKLSFPWLQRMVDLNKDDPELGMTLDPTNLSVSYAGQLIQDVFASMLANLIPSEPRFCATNADCPYLGGDPAGNQICNANRCTCTMSADCQPGEYCVVGANGLGYCTSAAHYWDNMECNAGQCANDEFCDPLLLGGGLFPGLCADKWSELPRSQARLARTAASLTANVMDFADSDLEPTRIGVRSYDFTRGLCYGGNGGEFCRPNSTDCLSGTCTIAPAQVVGRDRYEQGSPYAPPYVYGLEPQPFITAVSTVAEISGASPPALTGWAVELFTPFALANRLPPTNTGGLSEYWLVEVPPSTNDIKLVTSRVKLADPSTIPGYGLSPFMVFYFEGGAEKPYSAMTASSHTFAVQFVTGGDKLKLAKGSTLYLVWRYSYPDDGGTTPYTEIVIDQFSIPSTGNLLGAEGAEQEDFVTYQANPTTTVGSPFIYVRARGVPDPNGASNTADSIWLAPIPITGNDERVYTPAQTQTPTVGTVLGTYHAAPDFAVYPVVMGHAGTDRFDTAYPSPGSLLLPLRLANRNLLDYNAPNGHPPVTDLAFTAWLVSPYTGTPAAPVANYTLLLPPHPASPGALNAVHTPEQRTVAVQAAYQIDNGRMPIFDTGIVDTTTPFSWGAFGVHHVPPQVESYLDPRNINDETKWPGPGSIRSLPWGQLIFDYFTSLPLNNPGPYFCADPLAGTCPPVAYDPTGKPRVDQDGLRVHGRLNLNAAPWKALAGLPFVPMNQIPVDFQAAVATAIQPTALDGVTLVNANEAGVLGNLRAQAIVAYRDAQEMAYDNPTTGVWATTGDYGNSPNPLNLAVAGGYRGWKNPVPQARRGTGFMTIGELANIRNPGASNVNFWLTGKKAAGLTDPLIDLLPEPIPEDNNTESFIAAAAPLIALNEWASVRSHVFTVYGVFRGERSPDLDPAFTNEADYQRDIDSRAIRFQETIDRLPVFLGQPLPQRIGERAAGAYTDYRNN